MTGGHKGKAKGIGMHAGKELREEGNVMEATEGKGTE